MLPAARLICCAISVVVAFAGMTTATFAQASQPSPELKTLAADSNAFAIDLYGRLAGRQGNLFLSPYSIHSALTMTYAGARGETASQMAHALHFSLPSEQLHPASAQFIKSLEDRATANGKTGYELVVANALWGQKGYPYQPAFLNLLTHNYNAGLQQVDFAEFDAARQQINAWVEKQTRDKIKDLIAPGVITAQTRLVLTNAIYFKGAWAEPFRKEFTKEGPFQIDSDHTVQTELMHQQHEFPYMETEDLQAVELPYAGRKLSMVVLLPKKIGGVAALEKQLTPEATDRWLAQLTSRHVDLTLPKFTMTGQFELSADLQAMGMTDAFLKEADFSGITTAEGLAISKVIHKAFVDVNEEGTEAAAATAVVMNFTGAPRRPEPPVVFCADHPFVFMIRDRQTNAILFMGRMETK